MKLSRHKFSALDAKEHKQRSIGKWKVLKGQFFALAITILLTVVCIDPIRDFYKITVRPTIRPIIPWIGGTYTTVDDKGIPKVHYGPPIGDRMNPVVVSQYAMHYWEQYTALPGIGAVVPPDSRERFITCVDWLLTNAVHRDNLLVWEYDFPWVDLTAPWISAMAQGQAIQVLVRAHGLTRDTKYLDAASKALNVFFVDIPDGGVRIIEKQAQNIWWYAEYPSTHPRKVLNGMILALMGVHEYYLATGDARAKTIFNNGIRAVLLNLEEYDAGNWSYYDARGYQAGRGYHRIHISLLRRLYEVTKEEKFRHFAEKWCRYKRPYGVLVVLSLYVVLLLPVEFVLFVVPWGLRRWYGRKNS